MSSARAKAPSDPITAYILANYKPGMKYRDLAEELNERFDCDLSGDAVRQRVRKIRVKYGDNFSTTFSQDMEGGGFEGDNWSHGWLKSEKSSIFIRNEQGLVTYEDIRDDLIAEMKKYAPKYPTIKRNKISGGHNTTRRNYVLADSGRVFLRGLVP